MTNKQKLIKICKVKANAIEKHTGEMNATRIWKKNL